MIRFNCANCGNEFKVPDEAAGLFGKCNQCGHRNQVPLTGPKETPPPAGVSEPRREPADAPRVALSPPPPPPRPGLDTTNANKEGARWNSISSRDSIRHHVESAPSEEGQKKHSELRSERFDKQQTIGAWIAGGGLVILGLSPFFSWVNILAGEVNGLAGDGKIVLAVTAFAAVGYATAVFTRKSYAPIILAVQAWGTVAAFWMGALIWKIGSIPISSQLEDNPT